MNQRIRILSDALINQIAAGEVVERPASVVKELVENSLDAGARRVEVELEAGGRALIRVSDDGHGMSRDDALLCFERHATSKITTTDDLFAVQTLGFRGEAIPSIAEISRFELRTGERGAEVGTEVIVDGGRIERCEDSPNPGGTEIRVRRLFFNTPVRLKFLKAPPTELGYVTDLVERLALSRPDVGFTLRADGRVVLDVPPGQDLHRRAFTILGKEAEANLRPLETTSGDLKLRGLVSAPTFHKASSASMALFVNGRVVKDKTMTGAVLGAYRGIVPRGRYPVCVLFLDVPSDRVDHNVHPAKAEVRFRDPQAIWGFFRARIQDLWRDESAGVFASPDARQASSIVQRPSSSTTGSPPTTAAARIDQATLRLGGPRPPPSAPTWSWDGPPAVVPHDRVEAPRPSPTIPFSPRSAPPVPSPPGLAPTEPTGKDTDPPGHPREDDRTGEGPPPLSPSSSFDAPAFAGRFSELHPIGQYGGTFLLLQAGADLVVIDQHAAHERVVFEQLRRADRARPPSQRLLLPDLVELDRASLHLLLDRTDLLGTLGLEVAAFGERTLAVHAVPAGIDPKKVRRLLKDVADELKAGAVPRSPDQLRDALASVCACHTAVRAGDRLQVEEVRALLRQLDQVDFGFACPHGRPIMARFERREVERWFVRD